VRPGEVLRHERLDVTAARAALDRIIAPGARAVTVLAERAAGVGGLLRPADQVDVIVTIRPDSDELGADWVTETILQNVRVLAIDTDVLGAQADTKDAKKKNDNRNNRKILVTLEVMPDEAEKLALSASRGDLHLTLRGAQDDQILPDHGPLVTNALVGLKSFGASDAAATRRKEVQAQARKAPSKTAAPAEPTTGTTMEIIQGSKSEIQKFDDKGDKISSQPSRGGGR
jgi:pilus assembly protein CpaB